MKPMIFRRTSRYYLLTGLLTLLAFTGDIVADAVAELRCDHCVSACSHNEKVPCSHCSCAVHNGSVVASDNSVHIFRPSALSFFIGTEDQSAATGVPVAIDHPPELA